MRLLVLFFIFSFNASSAERTPAERMLNAMGINQILDQAKQAQAKATQDQVTMVMRQLSGVLSKLPKDKINEIELLFKNMMVDVSDSWTTEEAVRIYSQTWTDNFTEKEILDVVKKYEQPESQRELEMVLKASSNLNNYILSRHSKATEIAMANFLPKMQSIIKGALTKKMAKKSVKQD